jgi:hypothetical protein
MWICTALLALSVGLVVVQTVQAEELVVTPSQAVVLPSDGSGLTKAVLLYDLSGLVAGDGRQIDAALVDWHLTGVPSAHESEYNAFAASAAWTEGTAEASGVGNIANGTSPAAEWTVTTTDYDRNDGGFVRLNLTDLVASWANGSLANYGIVVTTDDVSRTNVANSLSQAVLTVRYGFVK